MVPGFVQLGALAVLFQVLVVAGLYGYVAWRRSGPRAGTRTRARWMIGGGVALVALGQLVALGAVGSLRTTPVLSLRRAIVVQNAGVVVALVGYVVVVAGFVRYGRSG